MLYQPFEEKRLLKWRPPFIVQPKLDGVRCRAVWDHQSASYFLLSSTEHEIISVPHIVAALNKTQLTAELDGELYCHGMSFEDIYSRTSRTVNLSDQASDIEFFIFDIVSAGTQYERTSWVKQQQFCVPLRTVTVDVADSLDDIMRCYEQFLNEGYEGIIVRHIEAPYVRKRSTMLMKFKPKKDDWYTVVGVQEELDKHGQPKGTLGSLICCGDDGSRFNVGSGLTRDQRNELWLRKHTLLRGLCHVKYQHITSGKNVPRFPVFISVDPYEPPDEVA